MTVFASLQGAAPLAFAFLLTVVHFAIEPLRWRAAYLPRTLDAANASKVADTLLASALGSYLLPFKLGIPLRIALLRRSAGLEVHHVGVVLAVDTLVSLPLWTASACAALAIASLHWRLPEEAVWGAVGALVIMVAAVVVSRPGRWRRFFRWREVLHHLDHPVRRAGTAALLVQADIFSYAARHVMLLMCVANSGSRWTSAAAIGVVATFAGIVSGLPMGLLGYDATLVALLTVAGLEPESALAMAALNRLLNLAAAFVLGVPAARRLGLGMGLSAMLKRMREVRDGRP